MSRNYRPVNHSNAPIDASFFTRMDTMFRSGIASRVIAERMGLSETNLYNVISRNGYVLRTSRHLEKDGIPIDSIKNEREPCLE